MDQSLSIVLPVYNAQHTLARQINDLLDVLSDLASHFEVLIVDDGSTDQTDEVAHELSRQYPQLSVVRHAERRGAVAAIQTGLQHTRGDVVLVKEEHARVSPGDIRQLWELRGDDQLVMARAEPQAMTLEAGLIRRLMNWGAGVVKAEAATANAGGIQMIRRRAIQQLNQNSQDNPQLTFARMKRRDAQSRPQPTRKTLAAPARADIVEP